MKKFVQNKLKDQKGMTLIELLAVIVIIAIIAAIAIPAIGNIIENSRFGAAKSDVLNAFASAELYIADEGKVPATAAILIPAYLETNDTLSADTTFAGAGTATSPLTIAGKIKVNNKIYTFKKAETKSALTKMTTKDFIAALTAPTS